MGHNNNFGFLRLVLALLVLLSHSPELIDGNRSREIFTNIFHTISFGELAVDGFFLLSGYLIIQSWQRTPKLGNFVKKRILRIYPGFIVATLICLFIIAPLGAYPIKFPPRFDLILCLKELFLLSPPYSPAVFLGQPHPALNGAMWTIAYEFRCYLLVAVLGTFGLLQQRKIWLILSVVMLVIYIFPGSTLRMFYPKPSYLVGSFGYLVRFLVFFCSGGCFYLWREQIKYNKGRLLVALFILTLSLFNSNTVDFALPTLGAYLFFWIAFLELPILKKFANYPDISYGVYLYGWPTQKLLIWYFPLISPWLLFILSAGVCVICGWLSWTFVEKPCLRLRN